MYRTSLELETKKHGNTPNQGVATRANNLAMCLHRQKNYKEAKPLMTLALETEKQLHGEEHLSVALAMDNLATILSALGQFSEAEPLCRKALAIFKASGQDGHAAICAGNLAGCLEDLDRMDEAKAMYQEALEIKKKVFGNEHPRVSAALHNLAVILWVQDHGSVEANRLGKQALEISAKSLGPDHPRTRALRQDWWGEK